MDEEALINIVREYRELYDTEHKLYEDHNKRDAAWQEISKRTAIPVTECRDRWKRLRDNYRKAKKLRQLKRSQGFTKIKKIKHEKSMTFLDQVMTRHRSDSETMKEIGAGSTTVLVRERHAETEDPLSQERTSVEEPPPKPDTLIMFFTNLGETVKGFPEEVQIRVKRDIFKIINEAEEDVCRRKSNDVIVKYESST